jgi:hypothetical protein
MKKSEMSEGDKFIYIFHSVTVTGGESVGIIVDACLQENFAYQNACKVMLQDLRGRFGDPKPLVNDDELSDPNVFNNKQMTVAFDCYKNIEKWTDGPNTGKLKMSWGDRYRRIDAIYEKLRSDKPSASQTYYYMTKSLISGVAPLHR